MGGAKAAWDWFKEGLSIRELLSSDFAKDWIYPFVLPVAAAISGYLQTESVMWIITATSLCLMAVTASYLLIVLIHEKRSPQNKLTYQPVYQQDLDCPQAPLLGNRQQRRAQAPRLLTSQELNPEVLRKIEKAQLGVEVYNNSPYPISTILRSSDTSILGERPRRSTFPKPAAIVGPWSRMRIADDPIDMENAPCQKLSGWLDMVIMYGRPGNEKYELHPKGVLDIALTDYGFLSSITLSFNESLPSGDALHQAARALLMR